jgi:hypothetical protein
MNVSLMPVIMKRVSPAISKPVFRTGLVLRKQSPHICFAAGLGGMVASTVLACRSTLHLSDTLDEIQGDIREAKDVGQANYPNEEAGKDLAYVYIRSGLRLGKLYGPALSVGVVSVGLLSSSHIQLARRNAAMVAAYTALQTAYENYRQRVRDEFGEEKELDLYHAKVSEIEDEKGDLLKVADPNKWSPYARFFDEYSEHWKKDAELNRLFVQCQQNWANEMLRAKGHLFLNEVYDMLGLDRSSAGAVVGWVIGEVGDNYVDFGMYEATNSAFINGWERSILLDFNVDGVIYDKI